MICDNCKTERLFSDFINNQKFCYHCEYMLKMLKKTDKRVRKPVYCRTCKGEIVFKESLKKRQRTVFCSEDCALEGHRLLSKNHWTRMIGDGYFGTRINN